MSQTVEYVIYGVSEAKDWKDWVPAIASAVSGTISVFVAIWALLFTKRQSDIQEKHNKLSVTPHLDGMSHKNDEEKSFQYQITNNGVGPAIVREASFFVDGKRMESDDPVVEAIRCLLPNIKESNFGHESIGLNSFIAAGSSTTIMTLHGRGMEHTANDLYQIVNKRAYITGRYESVYGESFVFDSRDV